MHHFVVDGQWANWGGWSTCSTTCGAGRQSRSRTCTNPPPLNGGAACRGSSTEGRTCKLRECPVDGAWGNWGSWGSCSKYVNIFSLSESQETESQFKNSNTTYIDYFSLTDLVAQALRHEPDFVTIPRPPMEGGPAQGPLVTHRYFFLSRTPKNCTAFSGLQ